MSDIIKLDKAKAEIVIIAPGIVCVYGWDLELVTENGQRPYIPLSGLVGIYHFKWTARIGMRRWLYKQSR